MYKEYLDFIDSLAKPMPKEDKIKLFSLKMYGELGEIVDYLAKVMYHGFKLDRDKVIEEFGDFMWYVLNLGQYLFPKEDVVKLLEFEIKEPSAATLYVDLVELIFYVHSFFTTKSYGDLDDVIYFTTIFLFSHFNITLKEVIEFNIQKLKVRLPKGKYDENDFKNNR